MALKIGGVNLKTLGMHGGYANVSSYGGSANGTYDNSGIVQAIIDGFEVLEGGTILFPVDDSTEFWRFTTGVVNDSSKTVNFMGTGHRGSDGVLDKQGGNQGVLFLDNNTPNAALLTYAGPTSPRAWGQRIENLAFNGRMSTDGIGTNQSAINFAGRCGGHLIRNCGFQFWSGYAIAHDPSVLHNYNQNSAIRDSHFWNVGGCFGPTQEYSAGFGYLFASGYTLDNVGLDNGVLWAGSNFTPKPYIWDLRATRQAQFPGILLIEGTGASGQTACMAFAAGSGCRIGRIHYEITTNQPTYFAALYGVSGGTYNATGEKTITIGEMGGGATPSITGFWFQDDSTNETIVNIDSLISYTLANVGQLVVWENGVAANNAGRIDIRNLETKTNFTIPQQYRGRVNIRASSGMDKAGRNPVPVTAPRLLGRWNANDGSIFRDFGDFYVLNSGNIADQAIEADGDFFVHRFTGEATTFPQITFQFRVDELEGAYITFAFLYRCTIDAADTGSSPQMYTDGTRWEEIERFDHTSKNTTDYVLGICSVKIGEQASKWFQTRVSGSATTVAPIYRLAAFEAWLGCPQSFNLQPAFNGTTVPSFGNTDATPSVTGYKTWKTGTTTQTITDLDNFPAGEERTIISKGTITFDTTGTNLVGSSADLVTNTGDITKWVSEDGTTKRLIGFVDVSIDNSAGA